MKISLTITVGRITRITSQVLFSSIHAHMQTKCHFLAVKRYKLTEYSPVYSHSVNMYEFPTKLKTDLETAPLISLEESFIFSRIGCSKRVRVFFITTLSYIHSMPKNGVSFEAFCVFRRVFYIRALKTTIKIANGMEPTGNFGFFLKSVFNVRSSSFHQLGY